MNSSFLRQASLVAVLLLACALPQASGDENSLRAFFENARNQADVKAKGQPGFVLRGDVRVHIKKDATSDGKFLFVWSPDGKWKEELVFTGYKRTRIGNGQQFWQTRSTESESPLVFELGKVMTVSRAPKVAETDRFKLETKANAGNIPTECIKREIEKRPGATYCFDAETGDLLSVSAEKDSSEVPWQTRRRVFSDFQDFAGKRLPRTLLAFNGKQVVIELRLEDIKPLPVIPSDFFVPPTDATEWGDCPDGEAWKLKDRTTPAYPSSARAQHHQGTVTLYATIEDDGRPSKLQVFQSAGADLDESAIATVRQWRYERTSACSTSKGRNETIVDVIYSLSP